MLTNCLLVGIGGFIGTILRYLITTIPLKNETLFPYKTFIINVLSCLFIGLILSYAEKHTNIPNDIVTMLKVGICGGFSTFSTFAYETTNLIQNGHIAIGITYALLSIIIGVSAVLISSVIIK